MTGPADTIGSGARWPGLTRRGPVLAWWLAGLSLAARIGVTFAGQPFTAIDLRVYFDGARALGSGGLYQVSSGAFALPFTYPPFAAMVFWPLQLLGWWGIRWIVLLGNLALLAVCLHLTFRLLGRAAPGWPRGATRSRLLACWAVLVWLEPVAQTISLGQVNLALLALVLAAVLARAPWRTGLGIGLAAAIKLVPAITGLLLLLQRRFTAVIWAAVVFGATIGLSFAVFPGQTRQYFSALADLSSRVGDPGRVADQSLRGALSRLAGHDMAGGALLYGLDAVVLLAALWVAARLLRRGDAVGGVLAVELAGLELSPIAWAHHWVWIVPLLLWCGWGPAARRGPVRALGWVWLLVALIQPTQLLRGVHENDVPFSRPGWVSGLETVYVLLGLVSLVVLALATDRRGVGWGATREPGAPG